MGEQNVCRAGVVKRRMQGVFCYDSMYRIWMLFVDTVCGQHAPKVLKHNRWWRAGVVSAMLRTFCGDRGC